MADLLLERPGSHISRVLSVGAPTISLNLVGFILLRLRSNLNARIFLSGGALLLPLLIVVILDEYSWFDWPQQDGVELIEASTGGAVGATEIRHCTPTNLQLTIAMGLFVAQCIYLFRLRAPDCLSYGWESGATCCSQP